MYNRKKMELTVLAFEIYCFSGSSLNILCIQETVTGGVLFLFSTLILFTENAEIISDGEVKFLSFY